jgi:hypothetical protein
MILGANGLPCEAKRVIFVVSFLFELLTNSLVWFLQFDWHYPIKDTYLKRIEAAKITFAVIMMYHNFVGAIVTS